MVALDKVASGEQGSTEGLTASARPQGTVSGSSSGKSVTFGVEDLTPSAGDLAVGGAGLSAW
jgi:hypothetical protein